MTRDEQAYVDILIGENKEFKNQIETLRKENYTLETRIDKFEKDCKSDFYTPYLNLALIIFIVVVSIKISKL